MNIRTMLALLMLAFSSLLMHATPVKVLSGGGTTLTQALTYKAFWLYKDGWYSGGSAYYNPNDPNHMDYELIFDLASANARWGSFPAAQNTLQTEYGFEWMTGDCESVQQFDSVWQ